MQDFWNQFTQRKASPLIQFIKYCMSGGVATVVHISIFYFLSWLVIPALNAQDIVVKIFHVAPSDISDSLRARNAMINNGLAFIFSNLTAYLLNIVWVFESGRHHPIVDTMLNRLGYAARPALCAAVHRTVEIGFFYLVSGIAIAIGTFLMWVLIDCLGFTTTIAFGAECIVAMLINFAVRKFMIFKG